MTGSLFYRESGAEDAPVVLLSATARRPTLGTVTEHGLREEVIREVPAQMAELIRPDLRQPSGPTYAAGRPR